MAEEKEKTDVNRTIYIQPTTGGQIEIQIPLNSPINNLKQAVATKLKVPKDKIVLLFKNRQLSEGTLEENNVVEGAKLTLLPSVETGLLGPKPEQCVMQALEALNETQVDNFLAGRSPLNLTMRLGDHMMFIQLQLSTIVPPPSNNNNNNNKESVNNISLSSLLTPPSTPTSPNSPSIPLRFPAASTPPSPPPSPRMPPADGEGGRPAFSNQALAEASRSLTHTLKHLSSAALSKKMNESCDGRCCIARKQGGAVIESMFHHGRGVYSGTFSGTLSPSLQDGHGRPRRDISTVIHILNDLLGASSHCRPSAQCLCSNNTSSPQQNVQEPPKPEVKVDGQQNQEENKTLREKMEQIQLMLEEKRQKRRARRNIRTTPYPTRSQTAGRQSSNQQTGCATVGVANHSSDHNDQTMADYSSETAVA